MIDLNRANKEFQKYLEDFDTTDTKIALKIGHTMGVVRTSEYISKELKLSKEDINLGKLIALLHDIGRFEQVKTYNNFIDYETTDHAQLGVKILFEGGLIKNFIDIRNYDDIILQAIINHNKLDIEEGLKEREFLHARLLRDADKADNFRVKAYDSFKDIFNWNREELENSIVSEKIYNEFMKNNPIVLQERETPLDFWVSYLAFIFDFNFTPGLRYIKENNYIDIIIDRIEYRIPDTKKKMEKIRKHSQQFINKRLENDSKQI